MKNLILIVILIAIISCAVYYIYRAKKRGQACIGCPAAKNCNGKCNNKF